MFYYVYIMHFLRHC